MLYYFIDITFTGESDICLEYKRCKIYLIML